MQIPRPLVFGTSLGSVTIKNGAARLNSDVQLGTYDEVQLPNAQTEVVVGVVSLGCISGDFQRGLIVKAQHHACQRPFDLDLRDRRAWKKFKRSQHAIFLRALSSAVENGAVILLEQPLTFDKKNCLTFVSAKLGLKGRVVDRSQSRQLSPEMKAHLRAGSLACRESPAWQAGQNLEWRHKGSV